MKEREVLQVSSAATRSQSHVPYFSGLHSIIKVHPLFSILAVQSADLRNKHHPRSVGRPLRVEPTFQRSSRVSYCRWYQLFLWTCRLPMDPRSTSLVMREASHLLSLFCCAPRQKSLANPFIINSC